MDMLMQEPLYCNLRIIKNRIIKLALALFYVVLCQFFVSCASCSSSVDSSTLYSSEENKGDFPMVSVPIFVQPETRAEYVLEHYWDEYTDTSKLYDVSLDKLEKAFSNYIALLEMEPAIIEKAGKITCDRKEYDKKSSYISSLFDKVYTFNQKHENSTMLSNIMALTEKYLYSPNSPFRDEELYLPFIRKMSVSPALNPDMQPAYEFDASMCALNRPGTSAANFKFKENSGQVKNLYDVKAEYTLLMFVNPGCTACGEIVEQIENNKKIDNLIRNKRLAVVAIYIDDEIDKWKACNDEFPVSWCVGYDSSYVIRTDVLYNVRAIPSLYLLDSEKKVIMKDAPEQRIFTFFKYL